MANEATTEAGRSDDKDGDDKHRDQDGKVTVAVNTKPITLASHRVTGLDVKQAAIAQGVQIELDFLLTLEAHGGHPAETIADDRTITVTKHSVFTANDADDDS